MAFTVGCPRCGEQFEGSSISEAMTAKRDHLEMRHLDAKIETDT